jgi:large subunit ribosomal protein L4e
MKLQANCYETDGATVKKTIEMPELFSMPIRQEFVLKTFSLERLGLRQPYAVSKDAGMQHSARSWGTGRAIARCPRVAGSGTRRAGQGAFANFCRKGRMAHPTKTTRRWARKVTLRTRAIAKAMAIASSADARLVEARGHRISKLKGMIPLIVSDDIQKIRKTKDAVRVLKSFGLEEELEKVKDSKRIRPGKGKMRNRRHVKKKGVLIVHTDPSDLFAFRNIEGVDLMNINNPNIFELAPGGTLGRLILWTESAFEMLDGLFGGFEREGTIFKGFKLPSHITSHDDLEELFYSDEVQAVLDEPLFVGMTGAQMTKEDMAERQRFIDKFDACAVKVTN